MLPFFFTALKVGVTLAFIGALVGEYFGGTSEVLGRVVVLSNGSFDLAWAGILIGRRRQSRATRWSRSSSVVIPWHPRCAARSRRARPEAA